MKKTSTVWLWIAGLSLAAPAYCPAQAVPTTPTKFNIKPVGSATGTTGASISPPVAPEPSVRHITYLTLSPMRTWTSLDGKSRNGKLIAWEERVTTTTTKSTVAPPPEPITTKPTVIKENKARLLIDNKVYEVPLERLGKAEQKFILELHTALRKTP